MASVYRARDTIRNSLVALKALRFDEGARHREARIAQFHREYRMLAELAHPRVIQVFDYAVDAEGPYYTMELLDGADLSQRAPLPWRKACALLRDVSSSLALLHSRGYLHRDVSPLNIRCTEDGRAKLIDFGAMAPMGLNTLAIGTPPCVAPEVLSRAALDGRTDLFALGATLYFTLTRRQAYAARSFAELRVAHARPVQPPSAYAPDVPPALDRLVLSLLRLDPIARPRHAAEVMDRLTTIAELGPIEPLEVRRAYLNTPELVGREREIVQIAEQLAEARSGRGRLIRIAAAAGGGRSRVLQTAVMDARLAGMTILQADGAAASAGAYGMVRALLRDLRDASPAAAARLSASAELAPLLSDDAAERDRGSRESVLLALSELIAEASEVQPILIAVDDIERSDEPSLAALVTIAAMLRKRAIALAYTDADREPPHLTRAVGLLRELASTAELRPLGLNHVEALLGSVFGVVPNLQVLSRFIYERTLGSPRPTVELAQVIVDRGLARYELGSWSLPSHIDVDALPPSLLEVRSAKLAGLSADALELVQLLGLADDYALTLDDLLRLTEHRSFERLEVARASLIEGRILLPGELPVLADRNWQDIARASSSAERAADLYARLGTLLQERDAGAVRTMRCWFRAGDEVRALDVLGAALRVGTLVADADSDYPDLLQLAAAACRRLGRPPLESYLIARELMALSDRVLVKDRGECFRVALERLRLDSGLADYEALPDGPDRLAQAIAAAQARYDSAAPRDRVLAPIDAIKGIVETSYDTAVYAAMVGDMDLLDALPNLAPFEILSPAIASVRAAVEAQRPLIGACYEVALEHYIARLDSLERERGNLTEAQYTRAKLLLRYALGSLQAGLCIKGALEHAQVLEAMPHGQILAAAVRESYYVRRGSTRAAEEWRRRMELLQIQLKRPHSLKLRQTTQQLECAAHADDLEEIKRNLEILEELAEIFPSAVPYRVYARAEYERVRGDYAAGLRHVQQCLETIRPARHPVWCWAAGCEVECLRLLGRPQEARTVGLARARAAFAAGLRVMSEHIETFVAVAEAELGDFDAAVEKLDRMLRNREQFGMHGLNLGSVYEARALVAMWMYDRPTFERCVAACAENYGGGRDNPALAARHERLLQEARSYWKLPERLSLPSMVAPSSDLLSSSSFMMSQQQASPLAECRDAEERARAALASLLRAAGCERGLLYLLRSDVPECVAGDGETEDHRGAVEELLARDVSDELTTVADTEEPDTESLETRLFRTIPLVCPRGERMATVGVLILETTHAQPSSFYGVVRSISNALIDYGDVQPRV